MLGRGVRLWDGLEGQEADYEIESVSTPSGVTHLTFTPGSVAHRTRAVRERGRRTSERETWLTVGCSRRPARFPAAS